MEHFKQLLKVLHANKLYGKIDKCSFMLEEVGFLGLIVLAQGGKHEPSKVEAIHKWLIPKTITEVRAFHGLASFYRRFVKNFSTVMEPITSRMKQRSFRWTNKVQKAFGKAITCV